MTLIDPHFYTGPALIVGDGNFSFSACLAEFLGGISPPVFATSLDNEEELQSNPIALENLQKISAFPTFKVIHGVDATNLESTFKDQIFHRIIFNFPHTGGKVKISKCRSLLEKFFISAARHIEPTRGVVCVSLCQGQGGTPRDSVQREYGNTWQVVEQGAKGGFILNTVHPFKESDYPGYNSAGFKGRLNQSFLTERGLTYMFIISDPIHHIPDTNSSLQMKDTSKKLFHIKDHPIEILKKKLEKCITNLPGHEGFNIINDAQDIDLSDRFSSSCLVSTSSNEMSGASSLYTRVQQCIAQGQSSFVVTDTEMDFSVPISAKFHPICHTMAIVRLYTKNTPLEEIESDLKPTYNNLVHEICSGVSFAEVQQNKQSSSIDLTFKRSQMNRFKPQEYQELRERQRNESEWRPKCVKQEEECHCWKCCSVQERTGRFCKMCEIEDKYLFKEKYLKSKHLVDNQKSFYGSGGLVFTCGLMTSNQMSMISDSDNNSRGWAILVHLDHLVMEVFGINDIRLLWSKENLFLQQYTTHDKDSTIPFSHFIPFSLFPPIYVHDISFWLTPDSTEEKFFKTINDVTQNCVCDVWLRDRYVDQDKNRVSYGYRMLYSRCDGPLTHLQTVEIQNLLRRVLIRFNFDLS